MLASTHLEYPFGKQREVSRGVRHPKRGTSSPSSNEWEDMPTATDARIHAWTSIEAEQPVPLLNRKRVSGNRMLVAHVNLTAGCVVPIHEHESEQMACVVSGRVKFMLGEPGSARYREEVVEGGTLVELPSHFPHGVEAIEDTLIIDILSPPAAMGVDQIRQ